MDLLRFTTAGSIDDGKSTLTGRLLQDTGNVKSDILKSAGNGSNGVNLAYITDGLRSEREGGITIDIGYKYFHSAKRKYIISDAPGHFRYTKNMVTGASNVDVMIVLIDARNGITTQTRIHSLVASFLGIQHIVVAINKMDLVHYSEDVFNTIQKEYLSIVEKLRLTNIQFIPISALKGDNIISGSQNMPWYHGRTLLDFLEGCSIEDKTITDATRFAVQYLSSAEDGRTLCYGKLLSGKLLSGSLVTSYPSGKELIVRHIYSTDSEIAETTSGENVTIRVDTASALGRGDVIAYNSAPPICGTTIRALLCWMDGEADLVTGQEYLLRINAQETVCTVAELLHKTDNYSFDSYTDQEPLRANQFAQVVIHTQQPVVYEQHPVLPELARGILINCETNNTIGTFIIN